MDEVTGSSPVWPTSADCIASQAIARPRATNRNTATTTAEPAFINSPEGQALLGYGHAYTSTSEIGAATGIEFLGGGRTLAAAEPVRRGGGSALVVRPSR